MDKPVRDTRPRVQSRATECRWIYRSVFSIWRSAAVPSRSMTQVFRRPTWAKGYAAAGDSRAPGQNENCSYEISSALHSGTD